MNYLNKISFLLSKKNKKIKFILLVVGASQGKV